MAIEKSIDTFLKKTLESYDSVSGLEGDASAREYFRVISGERSYILSVDTNFRGVPPEDYPFCVVYNMFRENGIPVPTICGMDSNNGLFLLEDGGDYLLETIYRRLGAERIREIYEELIRIMIRIQMIGSGNSQPFRLSFDADKLMFEFDFFIEHAVKNYFRADISAGELDKLRLEFQAISGMLNKPELFVLNHRDYHSRNVLVKDERIFLIDFQDARMGLPQYDLVSLLRDSYVVLSDSLVESLKKHHFNLLIEAGFNGMSLDEYNCYFDIMAFQRNIKAIGTFCYQATSLSVNRYEKYIAQTFSYLNDYAERRKELKKAYRILQKNML